MMENFPEKFASRRPSFTYLDASLVIFSMLTLLADVITDYLVVILYARQNRTGLAILTSVLIILPMAVVQIFSIRWLAKDEEIDTRSSLCCLEDNGGDVKRSRWSRLRKPKYWAHFLLGGAFIRYVSVLRAGWRARRSGSMADFESFYHEQNDVCILRLFESFTESAPQLVLQMYIMVTTHDWAPLTGFSALASLVSLAWAIAAYTKAMRNVVPDKQRLSYVGLTLMTLWRAGMISARVLALVMFASVFRMWILLVVGLHWLGMTTWVILQRTDFCDTWLEERVFNCVVGAIYVFSFFNLKEGRTRWRMLVFYSVMLCENAALSGAAYVYGAHDDSSWFSAAALSVVSAGFTTGLISMVTYYRFFHPNGPIAWHACCAGGLGPGPGGTSPAASVSAKDHSPSLMVTRLSTPTNSSPEGSDTSSNLPPVIYVTPYDEVMRRCLSRQRSLKHAVPAATTTPPSGQQQQQPPGSGSTDRHAIKRWSQQKRRAVSEPLQQPPRNQAPHSPPLGQGVNPVGEASGGGWNQNASAPINLGSPIALDFRLDDEDAMLRAPDLLRPVSSPTPSPIEHRNDATPSDADVTADVSGVFEHSTSLHITASPGRGGASYLADVDPSNVTFLAGSDVDEPSDAGARPAPPDADVTENPRHGGAPARKSFSSGCVLDQGSQPEVADGDGKHAKRTGSAGSLRYKEGRALVQNVVDADDAGQRWCDRSPARKPANEYNPSKNERLTPVRISLGEEVSGREDSALNHAAFTQGLEASPDDLCDVPSRSARVKPSHLRETARLPECERVYTSTPQRRVRRPLAVDGGRSARISGYGMAARETSGENVSPGKSGASPRGLASNERSLDESSNPDLMSDEKENRDGNRSMANLSLVAMFRKSASPMVHAPFKPRKESFV